MGDLPPGTRVRLRSSGLTGTVCPDLPGPLSCIGSGEVGVVFDGSTCSEATAIGDLNDLGSEDPQPDPQKCGAGREAECCIFLTVGPNGFVCERFTSLRWDLVLKKMSAERHPPEPYPACMIHEGEDNQS